MIERTRAHLHIEGQVQGVFFRQETLRLARSLQLSGWVRNLPDGRVEAVFEGDENGCSFLPDAEPVGVKMKDLVVDEIDLRKDGAVLETNRPYRGPLWR